MGSWYLSVVKKLLFIFTIPILLFSCDKEEKEYPFDQSPYVEFEDLVFHDGQSASILELSFIVWDKEGDVGFRDQDIGYPFHYYDVIVDSKDDPVKFRNSIEPPFYSLPMDIVFDNEVGKYVGKYDFQNKSFYSEEIVRDGEFSCEENIILRDNYYNPYDTLFGYENEYFFNLNVDFYKEEGNELDFKEIFNSNDCNLGNFNAKLFDISGISHFSPLDGNPFKIERRDRYSWKITYNMQSNVLKVIFLDKPFELRFSINDQALNESNIASSGLVTLEEITAE